MRFITALYHRLLYVLAYALLFFAIVFTLTRILSPLLNYYKTDLVAWASDLLGTQISIDEMNISWRGVQPEIGFQGVTIDQPKTTTPIFHLESLQVTLDLLSSLLHRHIQPGVIILSGANISVQQLPDGSLQINDLNLTQASSGNHTPPDLSRVDDFLARQPHIYLNHFNVQWTALKRKPVNFELHQLRLEGLGEGRYDLDTHFTVDNINHSDWRIMAHIRGKLADLSHLHVGLYVNAENINLLKLLPSPSLLGYQMLGGTGDLEAWMSWKDQKIQKVTSRVALYNIQLKSNLRSQNFTLKSLSGNFFWQPLEGGVQLSADQVKIISQNHVWAPLQFLVRSQPQKETNIFLSYMNVGDASNLLQGSALLQGKNLATLKALSPEGNFRQVAIFLEGPQNQWAQHYHVEGRLANFSIHAWGPLPGISPFHAFFAIEPQAGRVKIIARQAKIDDRPVFVDVFDHNDLALTAYWQQAADGHLQVNHAQFHWENPDIEVSGQLALDLLPKHPMISLLVQYQFIHPTEVPKYLPVTYMHPKTIEWLDQAFVGGGDAMTGNMILKGDLSHFPFDHHEGVFSIDTALSNLSLHFAPGWPSITEMKGDLLFDGRAMTVTIDHARWQQLKVASITATIPNLSPPLNHYPHLEISAHITDSLEKMFDLIHASPLNASLGHALAPLTFSGPSELAINLDILLHGEAQVDTVGQVTLLDDHLQVPALALAADQLKGQVNFKNDVVNSGPLTMNFLGTNTTAVVTTTEQGQAAQATKVHLTAAVPVDKLTGLLPSAQDFSKYLSGVLNYQADLLIYHDHDSVNHLLLHSDLFGLGVNLPRPLGKSSKEVKNFSLDLSFKNDDPISILVNSGDKIHVAFLLKEAETAWKLWSLHVSFGKATVAKVSDTAGLLVDGHVDYFNWKDWQPYVQDFQKNNTASQDAVSFLNKVDLSFDQFVFQNFSFSPFSLSLARAPNAWSIIMGSDLFEGAVLLPDAKSSPLEIHLKYLQLPKFTSLESTSSSAAPIHFADIPEADISIQSLRYQDHDLGDLEFSLIPHPDQDLIALHAISLTSSSGQILAEGSWKQVNEDAFTEFSGTANMSNIYELTQNLGIPSSLQARTGQIQFALNWPAPPWQFSVLGLSGTTNFTLGPGLVVNLGKEATEKLNLGKILTLLSINNIFSVGDLSKNGYAFQKMTGSLNFSKGMIQIKQLEAEGTVANIKMQGRVDAIKQVLDLRMGVMVNVTSSLPVVATIVSGFNPLVGVIAWAAGKVVTHAVSSGSKYNYTITGPFSKPVVTDLSEKNNTSQTQGAQK